jgi:hypothetical protein
VLLLLNADVFQGPIFTWSKYRNVNLFNVQTDIALLGKGTSEKCLHAILIEKIRLLNKVNVER